MKWLTGIASIFVVLWSVDGRGVDIGICGNTYFECSCGPEANGYKISIPVKECTFFYRWKPYCKPCKDIKKETLCAPYGTCLECNNDRCTRCPPNRYGQWCTGVCQCKNGATCHGQEGTCTCAPGFVGVHCEIKTAPSCPTPEAPLHGGVIGTEFEVGKTVTYSCDPGFALVGQSSRTCTSEETWSGHVPVCERSCPMPNLPKNLVAEKNPFGRDATEAPLRVLKFRCNDGLHLIGSELATCLPTGTWDEPVPQCRKRCEEPKNPKNGGVATEQVLTLAGSKAKFHCHVGYVLVGPSEILCTTFGNWSHPTPTCERVTFCPDPGEIQLGSRQMEHGKGGEFSGGTNVAYRCTGEALLLGRADLECLTNGTWSHPKPTCTIVRDEAMTCETLGADVVAEINVPVRITCPSGCGIGRIRVWGSMIYRESSSVCTSAIHAGMIAATGGSVFVVNNGMYNSFFSSNSNGIKSTRYRNPSESFRFNFIEDDEDSVCPAGWTQHGKFCAVYVDGPTSVKKAESICGNLASELVVGTGTDEKAATVLVKHVMPIKGPSRIWFGKNFERWSKPSNAVRRLPTSNSTLPSPDDGVAGNATVNVTERRIAAPSCAVLDSEAGIVPVDCSDEVRFVCRRNASLIGKEDVVCDEPEAVAFGQMESADTLHDLYVVGSSVTYRCDPLHSLRGVDTIVCTANGTWSEEAPSCVKVPACREPSAIKNGLYHVLPAVDARTPGGAGARGRSAASQPRGLSITFATNGTSRTGTVPVPDLLPPGHHLVGSRVQFTCESRYYNLIGSSTRTCMSEGHWSGRQPTCLPVCGISSAPRAPFIINGKPTKVGQWPWQVGLARRVENVDAPGEEKQWFLVCGGAVLTETWMVTAAHCVTEAGTTTVLPPSDFRLYFGKYYRNDSLDDQWVQVRRVKNVHVYPDFNPVLYDGDLALVELDVPVQLTSRVQPVCLPDTFSGMSDRHLQAGTIGVVTGWGVDEKQEYSSTLLQADVPVVASKECEEDYRETGVAISVSGRMFCAGFKEGEKQDACSGDSGGPFVMSEGAGVHERWYLEGIVSWGSPFGCAMDRQYGGYTKVAAFLDWIQQFI